MVCSKHSNIPENFCRILTPKRKAPNKHRHKKWLRQDSNYLYNARQQQIKELRKIKNRLKEENALIKIKESALNYKASARIISLAQPKFERKKLIQMEGTMSYVSPSALRYMPTRRILELAKPKYISEKREMIWQHTFV
ncbi:uncharacterized protein LOC126882915 [Diabrotica virgifera virgifera]|uniref:Uncharacterized protein n=1 Tax=Diabrotica virgifera virgifera TaxID=50390 RepID=A0ABM5K185_DIAVI|nr:uncharacterized protein LOC126882915 [Diabrotica virgifera virgifera]